MEIDKKFGKFSKLWEILENFVKLWEILGNFGKFWETLGNYNNKIIKLRIISLRIIAKRVRRADGEFQSGSEISISETSRFKSFFERKCAICSRICVSG